MRLQKALAAATRTWEHCKVDLVLDVVGDLLALLVD